MQLLKCINGKRNGNTKTSQIAFKTPTAFKKASESQRTSPDKEDALQVNAKTNNKDIKEICTVSEQAFG
jgi:hypothetical protein